MRVALLFDNFGPYHWARLSAAAGVVDLLAIEVARRSGEYAWETLEKQKTENRKQKPGGSGLRTECLFDGTSSAVRPAALAARLNEVLEPFRPEVVVVPGWASRAALAAAHWAQQHSVPTVVMSESTAWDEARKPWKEFIKRQIVASFSAVLVGGRPHADYLAQLGLPQDRIFLGYDAVDNDYFATKVAAVRSQTSTRRPPTSDLRPLASPYFLASARFIEKKNLPRLLQAYARYRQLASASTLHAPRSTLPEPWHLVLLGDGPLRPALSSQLHALGLQHSVLLPGFKQYPELPTYYGPASAFIHASTTEQWGLVVNEAMASGLPVLVSNRCGCARDLVREGENGFTFDPFNVEEMAQLMHKISAFNFPLSAFGDASARIIANWSPARFASGLKQAVACALRVRSVQPTLVQRAILAALLRR